jgi:RsiW-degrading membrane proteinase PrsW (M82 family)
MLWLLGKLVIIGFALFPAAVLTAFLVSHYRARMGARLIVRTLVLGAMSGLLVLSVGRLISSATFIAATSFGDALASAFVGAAAPEEIVKFLLLFFIVREHKDCDSGGDLFCAAMLIGLGFAGLENVLYLLSSGEHWFSLGVMRGVLAVPAHTVFGCLMGLFAANAYRGRSPGLNWTLALVVPLLGHGLYDFPLMMWSQLSTGQFENPSEIWYQMFLLLMAVLLVSGVAVYLICRWELVHIFANEGQDPDLHLPARWAVRPWRTVGTVFIAASTIIGGIGLWYLRNDELRAAFLLAPSVFPHVFGWVMRLQPPRESLVLARVAERR